MFSVSIFFLTVISNTILNSKEAIASQCLKPLFTLNAEEKIYQSVCGHSLAGIVGLNPA
jgi:hypothetical protein